jgi:hypothetical protein
VASVPTMTGFLHNGSATMPTDTSAAFSFIDDYLYLSIFVLRYHFLQIPEELFKLFFGSNGTNEHKVEFNKQTATLHLTVVEEQFPALF